MTGRMAGARLLTIVASAHDGCFEAYLNEMHDVRLVEADIVLKQSCGEAARMTISTLVTAM